jgi:hypothetical protein
MRPGALGCQRLHVTRLAAGPAYEAEPSSRAFAAAAALRRLAAGEGRPGLPRRLRAELLPERIDLVGFVLQLSGLGSLVALFLAVLLGADDAVYAKYGTLVGAYTGLLLFLVLAGVQEVG